MGAGYIDRTRTVERRPDASWIARRFIIETLQPAVQPSTVENAALLTSELVTNVMMHTGDDCEVCLTFDPAGKVVRVGVTDSSPTRPAAITAGRQPGTGGGFGLALVAGLALDWGSDVTACSKTVWFDLADDADA